MRRKQAQPEPRRAAGPTERERRLERALHLARMALKTERERIDAALQVIDAALRP